MLWNGINWFFCFGAPRASFLRHLNGKIFNKRLQWLTTNRYQLQILLFGAPISRHKQCCRFLPSSSIFLWCLFDVETWQLKRNFFAWCGMAVTGFVSDTFLRHLNVKLLNNHCNGSQRNRPTLNSFWCLLVWISDFETRTTFLPSITPSAPFCNALLRTGYHLELWTIIRTFAMKNDLQWQNYLLLFALLNESLILVVTLMVYFAGTLNWTCVNVFFCFLYSTFVIPFFAMNHVNQKLGMMPFHASEIWCNDQAQRYNYFASLAWSFFGSFKCFAKLSSIAIPWDAQTT